MKIDYTEFRNRVNKVCDNILSFYFVNPTEHRYERLKKILDRMLDINDKHSSDNEYRRDNWNMLITAKQILSNVGAIVFDGRVEKLTAPVPAYRNRIVTIECGTSLLSLRAK